MIVTKIPQTKNSDLNYGFGVVESEVYFGSPDTIQKAPRLRALVREDTNHLIGLVRSNYQVITHGEAIDPILEALDKEDLLPSLMDVRMSKFGARMYARLYFKQFETAILNEDALWPGIEICNSLDGSKKLTMTVMLYRLVCSNGLLVADSTLFSSSSMHTTNAKLGQVIIEDVVDSLENGAQEYLETFRLLASMPGPDKTMDPDKLLDTIKDLCVDGSIPKRYAPVIMENYLVERNSTQWNFYNAFNSVYEHVVYGLKGKVDRARDLDRSTFELFSSML